MIHTKFKKRLKQSDEGSQETGIMWKQGKENLQNNETGSLRRLQNLIVKLQKSPDLLETYDYIISNQLKEGIVEKVDKNIPPNKPEFYLPHKPVVRENAQSAKVRIGYDASAQADNQSKSWNEYLEPYTNLLNQIWKISSIKIYPCISVWRFKAIISANKNPRNLQRCIKVSLHQRS